MIKKTRLLIVIFITISFSIIGLTGKTQENLLYGKWDGESIVLTLTSSGYVYIKLKPSKVFTEMLKYKYEQDGDKLYFFSIDTNTYEMMWRIVSISKSKMTLVRKTEHENHVEYYTKIK